MTVADVVYQWLEKLKQANVEREHEWKEYEQKQRRDAAEKRRQRNNKPFQSAAQTSIPKKKQKESVAAFLPIKAKAQIELELRERQRLYKTQKLAGFVYLMRSENGYYKIGISKNTRNRLGGLKRQFPIEIEIIHQIACHDYRKVEKFLHNKYSAKRAQYEWFNLDVQDVKWLMLLRDYELG